MSKLISTPEVALRLGVTENILAKWRNARKGPTPAPRKAGWHRFEYDAGPVAEIRAALLVLGKYGLGLHGVPPLRDTIGGPSHL